MYLGRHWAYRREIGESQITFNYVRAMSDFSTAFTFSKGITFDTPDATRAIVPYLLQRIWEKDNRKPNLLWEMGNMGCTVPEAEALTTEGWKTLWELQARPDLPIATLNPATGDFEWQAAYLNVFDYEGPMVRYVGQRINHLLTPTHDNWVRQSKTYTVRDGKRWDHGSAWRKRKAGATTGPSWTLRGGADNFAGRSVMPTIPASREKPAYSFPSASALARFVGWWVSEGSVEIGGRVVVCQSPTAHPELHAEILTMLQDLNLGSPVSHGQNYIRFSHVGLARWLVSEFGRRGKEKRLPLWLKELPTDALVELMDGLWKGDGSKGQNFKATHVSECDRTWVYSTTSQRLADDVQEVAMKLGWLTYLSVERRTGLHHDKWVVHIDPRGTMSLPRSTEEHYSGTVWCPTVPNGLWFMRMNGRAVVTGNSVSGDCFVKVAYEEPYKDPAGMGHPGKVKLIPLNSAYCFPEFHPHDRNRMIRFKLKYRFWGTGPEGTRQVFTYVELITEEEIEEFVNDELIDRRPNPLGQVPIVHIRNLPISGSPWGMADIQDIIVLNRELNEKATDISDIINYHAAPVTVLIGAKANNLEKGPKKVWGIPNKDAKIVNLEIAAEGVTVALQYWDRIKQSMHEMMGIPEGALGQSQAISNTSGVALSIQYQPLMMKYELKKMQYGEGIEKINHLALLTIYQKEPNTLSYDELLDVPLTDNNLTQLDYFDPISYENTVKFQPPLPVDRLVKLNEIQVLQALGLESKIGALKDLGEEFPAEKLQELFNELVDDAEQQAALEYLRSMAHGMIVNATGMVPPEGPQPMPPAPAGPDGDGGGAPGPGGVTSAGGPNVSGGPGVVPSFGPLPGVDLNSADDVKKMFTRIVTLAHGTTLPQRRNPGSDDD
jgi:hypothetical protein